MIKVILQWTIHLHTNGIGASSIPKQRQRLLNRLQHTPQQGHSDKKPGQGNPDIVFGFRRHSVICFLVKRIPRAGYTPQRSDFGRAAASSPVVSG